MLKCCGTVNEPLCLFFLNTGYSPIFLKKTMERTIQTHYNLLNALGIDFVKPWVFFLQCGQKQKGSKNRNKARIKIATIEEHIANQRMDFHDKVSEVRRVKLSGRIESRTENGYDSFVFQDWIVWGLTYRILKDFIEMEKEFS